MSISAANSEPVTAPLPWFSHKARAIARWGQPLYRVPIDPGWSCPHRERGRVGGCTFCAGDGGRARQTLGVESLRDQMRCGIQFARERYGEGALELYIQAYTATYASARALRELVEPLLEAGDFVSLSLGTRPDCLPGATLNLLREWNQQLEVWVELVMQLLRRTPAALPIFRVFTDSDPENRLAPPSEFSKGRFLHELATSMHMRGWFQGELCP